MTVGACLILGASGAVGSELCRRLHGAGHRVVAAGRDYDRLNDAVGSLDIDMTIFEATDSGSVKRVVDETASLPEGLGAVVNCVGSILLKPAHAITEAAWSAVLRTNLDSAFFAVKHSVAAMSRSGGAIVLVSSAAASAGLASHEAIAAAKAGVEGLTRSSAATYAARGIRVNAVAPGLVRSRMSAPIFEDERSRKASEAMHALRRLGEPEDVASAIHWLLDAPWVTGQVVGVDGGLSRLQPRPRV